MLADIISIFYRKCEYCLSMNKLKKEQQSHFLWLMRVLISFLKISALLLVCVCVHAQFCQTLCDPVDCSPPGSSVHRISQTRILEWAAISSSRGSSRLRDRTCVSFSFWIHRRTLYRWATWEVHPPCVSFGEHWAHCIQGCKTPVLEGIWYLPRSYQVVDRSGVLKSGDLSLSVSSLITALRNPQRTSQGRG